MKINGWHIDGFGIFADERVEQINPGLTVFEGRNGAGKSTLFAFIQAMLFGSPLGRTAPKYQPLRGGQHGGALYITDVDDHEYAVHRQLNRRGDPTLTRNADPVDHNHLNLLLGRCDQTMFRAIFAFGLSELQALDALEKDETKDRLALAGLSGAGTSPQDVVKVIQKQTTGLLKQRSGKATINDLRTEMETINTELKHARQASAQYGTLREAEEAAAQTRDQISTALRQLANTRAQYQQLIHVWPSWFKYDNAERERRALLLDDGIASVADEVDRLKSETQRYEEWRRQRDEWRGKQRTAEAGVESQLRDLGPGWDRDRLISFDRSIPRREEIRDYEARIDETNEDLKSAANALRQAGIEAARARELHEQLVAKRNEAGEPLSQASLDHQRSTVGRLTATLAEATTLAIRVETDQERVSELTRARDAEVTRASAPVYPWFPPVAWLLALVSLGAGHWSLVTGAVARGAVLLTIAIILIVAGLSVWRRNNSAKIATVDPAREEALARLSHRFQSSQAQLVELKETIETQAAIIGAPAAPSSYDLADASARLDTCANHRRAVLTLQAELDEALATANAASSEVELAEEAHRDAVTTDNAVMEDWATWQAEAGVPTHLSPEKTIDLLAVTEEGRKQVLAAIESEGEAQRLEALITEFEARLGQAMAQVGQPRPEPGNDTIVAVDHLSNRLDQDRHVREDWRKLQQTATDAMTTVDELLGTGPRADESHELLRTGTKDSWEEQLRDVDERIESLEAQRETEIQNAQRAKGERQRLEESADIARLELELAGLKTEGAEAVREWAVLTLAEGMIKTTLHKFQRERQPAVLQHASGLFETVTDGRYTNISRSLDNEVQITTDNNQVLAPDSLSQGTMEQLYLCLRLGLAHSFSDQTGHLPLIMDDVLVNFDPQRAREVARVLYEVAADHQVLLFTCHPETVAMLQQVNGGCAHYKMGHNGEAGAWQSTG